MDSQALCAHIQSLYGSIMDHRGLQIFIGKLTSLSDRDFLDTTSDISEICRCVFNGDMSPISPENIHHVSLREVKDGERAPYGARYMPDDPLLEKVVNLDPRSEDAKLIAGLQKLKTAVLPRQKKEPSQKDFNDHFHSITDPLDADADIVLQVQKAIPPLLSRLVRFNRISYLRKIRDSSYMPLSQIPMIGKQFLSIDQNGNPVPRKRTEFATYDPHGLMRIDAIQDLYREDPDEFNARLFVGAKVVDSSLDLNEFGELIKIESVPLSRISFIPQPGGKERVVAVPTPHLQSLSKPIGSVLKEINSSWNVQGVDSHDKTTQFLSSLMGDPSYPDRKFYSIDMSNFTDRLPYRHVQEEVIRHLVNVGVLDEFDKHIVDIICESPVMFTRNGNIILGHYGVGTPMGTYPSFPLASLTNGLIAAMAYCDSHKESYATVSIQDIPARVIGDDIVIWDDATASRYKQIMDGLGVPVQPTKCIESTNLAEMCSKIINPTGVYQQKKLNTLGSLISQISGRNSSISDLFSKSIAQAEYYGMDELDDYMDHDLWPLIKRDLQYLPPPYGLGPTLDQPVWDSGERYQFGLIIRAILFSSTLGRGVSMNALDFRAMSDRRLLYPRSLRFTPDRTRESLSDYENNTLVNSVRKSVSYLCDQMLNPEVCDSLEKMAKVANWICAYQSLVSTQPYYEKVVSNNNDLGEYHISPKRNDTIDLHLERLDDLIASVSDNQKGEVPSYGYDT